MKSIKEMTDAVIDIVHENTDSDPEEWIEDDGRSGVDLNLSPTPECYEKLNMFFGDFYVELIAETLKNQFNQSEPKAPGR